MSAEIDNGIDDGAELATPVWAAFGDLMSVLLGALALILVGVIGMQLQVSSQLDEEVRQRQLEAQRRQTLEQALAVPLAAGRVTLVDGRIGISGSVLFALNSDRLQPEGRELLSSLAGPLSDYLRSRDQILMVSGFTDDRPIHEGNRRFADNWELSAQRALTVTRALIAEGVPSSSVFAAAFGAEQPVASNADDAGRASNRRVEMAPIPRSVSGNHRGSALVSGQDNPLPRVRGRAGLGAGRQRRTRWRRKAPPSQPVRPGAARRAFGWPARTCRASGPSSPPARGGRGGPLLTKTSHFLPPGSCAGERARGCR